MKITLLALGVINLMVVFAVGISAKKAREENYRRHAELISVIRIIESKSIDIQPYLSIMERAKDMIRDVKDKQLEQDKLIYQIHSRTTPKDNDRYRLFDPPITRAKTVDEMSTKELLSILKEVTETLQNNATK